MNKNIKKVLIQIPLNLLSLKNDEINIIKILMFDLKIIKFIFTNLIRWGIHQLNMLSNAQ